MFKFIGPLLSFLGRQTGVLAGKAETNPKTRDVTSALVVLAGAWFGIDASMVKGAANSVCSVAQKIGGLAGL